MLAAEIAPWGRGLSNHPCGESADDGIGNTVQRGGGETKTDELHLLDAGRGQPERGGGRDRADVQEALQVHRPVRGGGGLARERQQVQLGHARAAEEDREEGLRLRGEDGDGPGADDIRRATGEASEVHYGRGPMMNSRTREANGLLEAHHDRAPAPVNAFPQPPLLPFPPPVLDDAFVHLADPVGEAPVPLCDARPPPLGRRARGQRRRESPGAAPSHEVLVVVRVPEANLAVLEPDDVFVPLDA
ncbi:hypothetical protein THAOC_28334, partial [Thalassiosira oceanica]